MKEASKKKSERFELLVWYLLFGALHELAHITAYGLLSQADLVDWVDGSLLARALFLRQTILPTNVLSDNGSSVVRHVGWIFSVFVAVLCCYLTSKSERSRMLRLAAVLTALEALSTDLLGLYYLSSSNNDGIYYCGNFGIIFLHEDWCTADNGKTALDILENMISVTMVRGAQSGKCE